MRVKIGIIGAGKVGAETASEIVRMNLGDVVLLDRQYEVAKGKALDIMHGAVLRQSSTAVIGADRYDALFGCAVIIIAAGVPRTPGMTRDDLLDVNFRIVREIVEKAMPIVGNAIWIVVTNPLDAMTYTAWKVSGKCATEVMGMAGVLDAARLRALIALEAGVSFEDVQAMVLGSHGDLMVPLARYATVSGMPAMKLIGSQRMNALLEKARNAGTELVSLLKTGSAYYAAGASTACMVDAIVNDKRRMLCCCAQSNGVYGIENVFIGVPTILGRRGVDRIVELDLDQQERAALNRSAEHLRAMQRTVDQMLMK